MTPQDNDVNKRQARRSGSRESLGRLTDHPRRCDGRYRRGVVLHYPGRQLSGDWP